MFYHEAEQIVHSYIKLFLDPKIMSRIARYDNLLPCSKDQILLAYKVYMSFVGVFRNLKKEEVDSIFDLLNKLGSFIEVDEADHLNLLRERMNKKIEISKKELLYLSDFLMSSAMYSEHDTVVDVLNQVQNFVYKWVVDENRNLDDHMLYEYIYQSIIGVPYKDEYGIEFYDRGISEFDKGRE